MLGVGKLVTPVPPVRGDPPVAAAYQSMVSPVLTIAVRVTVPVPHLAKGPGPAVGAGGTAMTVAVTAVLAVETKLVVVFLACA
jgi:hypothetical protein